MNEVFRPFLRKFVLVFFDDILIYSKTEHDHVHHVATVLDTLMAHSLVLNGKKCHFGVTQVAYLGHIISCDGVSVDHDKIKAVSDWPSPKSVSELRGFLGLTGYYRRFVRGYAQIAQALTDLLKKDAFQWTPTVEAAFSALKQALATVPVLALPNYTVPFVIESDASGSGLGAVLIQDSHPIAFFSRLLGPRAQRKSIYERVLMAIVFAILRWKHYLMGNRFLVKTDQSSLKFIHGQREVGAEYQKWLLKIMAFDFVIVYNPGSSNKVADALSRRSHELAECTIYSSTSIDWVVLR